MSILLPVILNGLFAGCAYALIALGFNLIYDGTKFFNLCHGVVAVLGGYVTLFFLERFGMNIILAALFGILAAGICGFMLDQLFFKPLRKRRASNEVFLVASLGLMTALQAVLALAFSTQFKTFPFSIGLIQIFGATITYVQIVELVSLIFVTALIAILLKKTRFGNIIRAVSDSEEMAKSVGLDTQKMIGWIFFIGSSIAGLAGVLVGLDTGLESTLGLSLLLKGVVACIIGGVGNVYGGVLGALLLGLIENFVVWKFPGDWTDAVSFGVLILFLLFRPQGILRR